MESAGFIQRLALKEEDHETGGERENWGKYMKVSCVLVKELLRMSPQKLHWCQEYWCRGREGPDTSTDGSGTRAEHC